MEFWPTDFRADNSLSSKKRRSGKEVYSLVGQTLDVGSLGAATIALKDDSFEWKTLVQPQVKAEPRQVGESIQMLPPSRPPQPASRDMSARRKAEEGIKFLRTNYPDVDVSLELLQEETQADEEELKEFDPYQGNQIAQLAFLNKKQRILDFIALPVGETGSELNVFPIREVNFTSSNFIPVSKSLINFDTPIRQLETFPRLNIMGNYSLLAARTYGSVSMLKVTMNRRDSLNHPLDAEILHSFSSTDTNEHQVVDISCGGRSHTSGQMLLVNGMGDVFLSDIEGNLNSIASPADASSNSELEELFDEFWRIAWVDVNSYICTSAKQAHTFDLRAPGVSLTELFHLTDSKEYVTSIEATPAQSLFLGFSTTSRLLLFDVRHSRQPVISLNHHRDFDRTLRLKSFSANDAMWHTLSSSRNRLVTAYNTTSSPVELIQLQGMHSILPSSSNVDLPIIGSHIFQRTSNPPGSSISYLQLSSTGSLWSSDVALTEEELERKLLSPAYNEAMEELTEKYRAISFQFSEEDELESTEVDLSDVYQRITQGKKTEESRENFYQVLDKLPSFWQDTDIPTDDMLTTFDIALRSGQEPKTSLRADFLTESALNCPRGLACLLHDRMPTALLSQTAPWSFDLASLPVELVPDAAVPPKQLLDRLTEEAVSRETTDDGIKFTVEAVQELVMDLALSRHVYAPRKFSDILGKASAGDDNLLTATQALSLDSPTLPPSEFSYLQPVADADFKEGENKSDAAFELLPGVRLLLSEWKVGTKPEDYVFKDWSAASQGSPAATERDAGRHLEPSQPQSSQFLPPIVMSQPPPIVTSKIYTRRSSPSSPSRSLFPMKEGDGGSQMDVHMTQESVFRGQYPNTQPMPGPFGGQLNLNKKRPVKKRIGGF